MKKTGAIIILFIFGITLLSCKKSAEPDKEEDAGPDPAKNYVKGEKVSGSAGATLLLRADGTVRNVNYYTMTQPNLTGIIAVEGGFGHVLALKNDGTVWAWGSNNSKGELGDSSFTQPNGIVQVKGLTNVAAIAAGNKYSLALKNDGTVWAWGIDTTGQLGDSSMLARNYPVRVHDLNNVVSISAGFDHALAVKSDGTVWGWGNGTFSNLGTGAQLTEREPILVAGINGVSSVSAGCFFSLALKNDGTVWGWGYNNEGELGDGTTTMRSIPMQVTGMVNVRKISAGYQHSLALKNDSTIWAWGSNYYHAIGDGTGVTRTTAVQTNVISGVKEINAKWQGHSMAIDRDHILWAWGYNGSGQLGPKSNIGLGRSYPERVEEH
ncbi:MAG: hypothetical protein V4677_17870 [Bacteroidota bacterium]